MLKVAVPQIRGGRIFASGGWVGGILRFERDAVGLRQMRKKDEERVKN